MQFIPGGFNHQVILARVPAMPDIWHVVDAAFGSRSPLEPITLQEPENVHASGGQKSFLIITEQIHNQQNSDVCQKIFAGRFVIHRKSHTARDRLPALQPFTQPGYPAQCLYNRVKDISSPHGACARRCNSQTEEGIHRHDWHTVNTRLGRQAPCMWLVHAKVF